MNLDALIPVLDALSKLAESMPVPYVALAGAILAGIVVILRKLPGQKVAKPDAEVVQLPTVQIADAPADPKAQATVTDILNKTLNK